MRRVQLIRGNTVFNDAFIGNDGEITVDLQLKELRLHDGTTPGGKKFPNVDTIPTLSRAVFTAVTAKGAAGAIPVGDKDKMILLNAAGTYVLPDRSLLGLGDHFWFYTGIEGVSIQGFDAGQQIADKDALAANLSLNQFQTVHIALIDLENTATWRVLTSY